MTKVITRDEGKGCLDGSWDDTLLIKAYDKSVNLAREELARRISLSTSKKLDSDQVENNSISNSGVPESVDSEIVYNDGDYVRATYEDGIDYEAKILSIDNIAGTCVLKYIGYDNIQVVPLSELVISWGKTARRMQFAKAKAEMKGNADESKNCPLQCGKSPKKNKSSHNMPSIPPPPPIPPMLTTMQGPEDTEHLSAMLMSWYMSGYYTGVYQGMQMAKADHNKGKK